jgi:hypothetical protein
MQQGEIKNQNIAFYVMILDLLISFHGRWNADDDLR